jgi:hypothetical protein
MLPRCRPARRQGRHRHLRRATGQNALRPESRRYRELETGFFAKFVQQ